ncbi:acyl-CoA dehydrogenase family protein [Mycoplana ramosa]|uniref:Acyl-CoA dehydrogenase family protein n=1 Tax=Mycoplana ramosa TaxID=40837 RepID=A0ABW3YVP8_MYCRA
MGTTPAIGHPVRTAALIAAEDEATIVASAVAAGFEAAGIPQQARLEILARSGLLGVSIPSEHGGLDASNVALVEICAIAAETSATLAELLRYSFRRAGGDP